MVQFAEFSAAEREVIAQIIDRAQKTLIGFNKQGLMMDLAATHHSCPLKLDELLAASDGDFLHDLSGIAEHLDRRTGQLQHCFVPRMAR